MTKSFTIKTESVVNYYDESYFNSHYGHVASELEIQILSQYWKYAVFGLSGLPVEGLRVLDYGSGLGQVSAAIPDAACFDQSQYARRFVQQQGRKCFEDFNDIPEHAFDVVLSSHTLEHCLSPPDELEKFRRFVNSDGKLVLIVPHEIRVGPAMKMDTDRHLYAWSFQTITNLLLTCGWKPVQQRWLYGPFLLRTLTRRLPVSRALRIAHWLGTWKRAYPALLTVCTLRPSSPSSS